MDDFDTFYEDEYGNVLRSVTLALAIDACGRDDARGFRAGIATLVESQPDDESCGVGCRCCRERGPATLASRAASPTRRPDALSTTEDHASAVATAIDVREALGRLSSRQRAAVVLRYLTDLPVADIATALNCAEGTAKATLHQALAILRVDLDRTEP